MLCLYNEILDSNYTLLKLQRTAFLPSSRSILYSLKTLCPQWRNSTPHSVTLEKLNENKLIRYVGINKKYINFTYISKASIIYYSNIVKDMIRFA